MIWIVVFVVLLLKNVNAYTDNKLLIIESDGDGDDDDDDDDDDRNIDEKGLNVAHDYDKEEREDHHDATDGKIVMGFNSIAKYHGSDVIIIGKHNYCSEEAKRLVAKHTGKRILMQIPTMKTSTTTWHNLINQVCLLNKSENHKSYPSFSFPMATIGKSCRCCLVPYGLKFKSVFAGYEHVGKAELLDDWMRGRHGFPVVSDILPMAKNSSEVYWFTMLRSPLERIQSLYNHISYVIDQKYPDMKSWLDTLIDWASRPYDYKKREPSMGYQMVDHQSFQMLDYRQLTDLYKTKKNVTRNTLRSVRWQYVWKTVNGSLPHHFLTKMKSILLDDVNNLDIYPFLGLTDRFDDSFELFLYQFNITGKFPLRSLQPVNTGSIKKAAPTLDPYVRGKLLEFNKMDVLLYDEVEKEFNRRFDIMRQCQSISIFNHQLAAHHQSS